jgi:hypothetical protein
MNCARYEPARNGSTTVYLLPNYWKEINCKVYCSSCTQKIENAIKVALLETGDKLDKNL